jgi:hypothetical protein
MTLSCPNLVSKYEEKRKFAWRATLTSSRLPSWVTISELTLFRDTFSKSHKFLSYKKILNRERTTTNHY